MRVPRLQEVEVAPLVRLQHVLRVELAVAARVLDGRGDSTPRGAVASSASLTRSVEPALGHVELDEVAVAHERQRPADERLRRHVQHARAVGRAAHARVRDPHHVAHACLQQLLRNRQHAPLGHPRPAQRAGMLQHEHRVGRDRQVGIVDARRQVVVVAEHHAPARCAPAARGVGRGLLDHGAVGRQVAAQRRRRRLRATPGWSRRRITSSLETTAPSSPRPACWPLTVIASRCSRSREPRHHAAQAAGVVEVLHQEPARRADVADHRRAARQGVEAIQVQRDARAPAIAIRWMIALVEPPMRHGHRDRVVERLGGHDVASA